MRALIALTSSLALAAAALSAPSFAAAASGGATMKECAAQWQTMKKDNKTGGQSYKDFSAGCMAKGAPAPAAAAPAAKPLTATKLTTASTASKAHASTGSAPGQRMKDCGAKWQSLKAANKTGGETYQQFSKTCLSSKG